MSSSDRRSLILGLAAAACVAGCGYTPAYAPAGRASGLQGEILVDAPNSDLAFFLAEELERRLGRAANARYRLSYDISTNSSRQALTNNEETTRYYVRGRLSFQLRDEASGAVVQSGRLENFTAYSSTASTIATLTAERDAEKRLMVSLADELVTRLVATTGSWRK